MHCLILAAGYATRLYPLTENFPKPLLQVGGKTILDWLLEDIASSGAVDGYTVISNHKYAAHFQTWAGAHPLPVRVVDDGTEDNESRLGAVRDIQFAVEARGLKDDLLIIAGDNLLDFSLCAFIRYALDKQSSCALRYAEPDEGRLRRCGVAEVAPDDRLLSLEEKPERPKSHWCTPPFYYYTARDAALIPKALADGCGTDAPGSLLSWMCRHTLVYAMEMPGSRYDIGTLASYEAVRDSYHGITR